jgi:hypothetical protein
LPYLRFLNIPHTDAEFGSLPRYFFTNKRDRNKRISNEGLELTTYLLDHVVHLNPVIKRDYKPRSETIGKLTDRVGSDWKYIMTHVLK